MAARPGRVVADIAIEGSYPRAENFRTTEAYAKDCATVSDALTATLSSQDIDH
jgi:NitT/TauT family transport system ATP-binding protein